MTIDERLERLVERHEALTETVEMLALRQADAEERHEREMEEIRKEGVATRAELRRAIRLGIQEARSQRRRRHELDEKLAQSAAALDEKITQLAAAQLVTEEKLQRFINSLHRGGNG